MKRLAAILLLLVAPLSARADITTNLQLWYKFDDGSGTIATDSSGNSRTGTLTNGPTWVSGKVGTNALSFTAASSQYVNMTSLGTTTAMTHGVWVYKTSSGTQSPITWGKSMLQVLDTSVKFFPDTDNFLATFASVTIPQNTWTHICATHTGTTSRLYVNGAEVGSSPQTSGAASTTSSLTSVGRYAAGNSNYWNGQLDEVRIYSRALPAADVTELYNYGLSTVKASRGRSVNLGIVKGAGTRGVFQ